MIKSYIGTMLIKAKPMSRQDYNDYRGWELPDNENGRDEGYLVEYVDGGQSNHPDHEGYIFWSPSGVFYASYRPIEGLSFGMAVESMKNGLKLARKGWNGKNMYVFLIKGSEYQKSLEFGFGERIEETSIQSALAIKTAGNQIQVGWLASQADMLSDDWRIV